MDLTNLAEVLLLVSTIIQAIIAYLLKRNGLSTDRVQDLINRLEILHEQRAVKRAQRTQPGPVLTPADGALPGAVGNADEMIKNWLADNVQGGNKG